MFKHVQYLLMFIGIGIAVYDAIKDFDPLTLIGTFVFVMALMLNVIVKVFK